MRKLIVFFTLWACLDTQAQVFESYEQIANYYRNLRQQSQPLGPAGGMQRRKIQISNCDPSTFEEIKRGIREGINCIARLNTPKALLHIKRFQEFFIVKGPKQLQLNCSDKLTYQGETVAGMAQSAGKMPTMWINTTQEISATGFHEAFHLVHPSYYTHAGVDYVNNCEKCCFQNIEAACQICSQ